MQQARLFDDQIGGVWRVADAGMVASCRNERGAIQMSIELSGLKHRQVAALCGISGPALSKWKTNGVPRKLHEWQPNRVKDFCGATGTMLLAQWIRYDREERAKSGREREAERIALIAQHARRTA
jgi:hypothetical protein